MPDVRGGCAVSARERLLSYALSATPNEVTIAKCEELADDLRAEVRAEVAADVHRAGLPSFPAGERPDLVAKTVRAVDVRIAEQGAEAPYGVAEQPSLAGEQPNFYESGRTYLGDYGWQFRVDIITTHPEDGERTALGWRRFNDAWEPYAYGEGDWEIHLISGLEIAPEGGSSAAGRAE
ncbi:hypothetical protein [Streptomyces sp. NPDC056682]|uniref:hypothetical protein n=1 Tax=Streptomyces sp. NPDC056682 TaxID=3345909 RepID=UPI0036B64A87